MTLREKLDNIEAEQRVWLGVGVYMAAKQVLRDKEISEEPEQVTWGSDWESDDEGGSYLYVYHPKVHTASDRIDFEDNDTLQEAISNYLKSVPKYSEPNEKTFTEEERYLTHFVEEEKDDDTI